MRRASERALSRSVGPGSLPTSACRMARVIERSEWLSRTIDSTMARRWNASASCASRCLRAASASRIVREQPFLAERLQHVAVRAGIGRAPAHLRRAVSRQRDDRHVALAADRRRGVEPVEAGQAEIEHDQVRGVHARELDRLGAVTRVGNDREAGILEDDPQVGAHDRIVIDGQDPGWCEGCRHELFLWEDGAWKAKTERGPGERSREPPVAVRSPCTPANLSDSSAPRRPTRARAARALRSPAPRARSHPRSRPAASPRTHA